MAPIDEEDSNLSPVEPVEKEYQFTDFNEASSHPQSKRQYPYPGSINDGLPPFKTDKPKPPFLSDYTIAPTVNELSSILKLQKAVGLPLTQPSKLAHAKNLSKQVRLKAKTDPGVLCTTVREINRTAKAVDWLNETSESSEIGPHQENYQL